MSDATLTSAGMQANKTQRRGPDLDAKPHASVGIIFIGLLIAGIGFVVQGLMHDISEAGDRRWPPPPSCCSALPC